MARIRLRFNQYKSNIKLNGERRRGLKKEKLIEHFLLLSHNGKHEDIEAQIISQCDPNHQEDRVFDLNTLNSSRPHIQKDDCLNYYEHSYI